MNSLSLLDKLLTDSSIHIQALDKGLTNHNYLLTMGEETFVLRIPREDASHIVYRHHETLALEAIANSGIDVETLYYDEISGYKVTRYLANAKTFEEYHNPDAIKRCALLMKHFHSLHKKIGVRFDPIARYHSYKSKIQHPLYNLVPFENILNDNQKLSNEEILCHNDWVGGNILFDGGQTYLIDYEYAGDNDPLFDVMSFLSENAIHDENLRNIFYKYYFDEPNEAVFHQLTLWECFHNLLWCAWAMLMWQHRQEEIYQNIAAEKFNALCTTYQKLYKHK